jgi:hypothetical protein
MCFQTSYRLFSISIIFERLCITNQTGHNLKQIFHVLIMYPVFYKTAFRKSPSSHVQHKPVQPRSPVAQVEQILSIWTRRTVTDCNLRRKMPSLR